jgi:hypothetical protein
MGFSQGRARISDRFGNLLGISSFLFDNLTEMADGPLSFFYDPMARNGAAIAVKIRPAAPVIVACLTCFGGSQSQAITHPAWIISTLSSHDKRLRVICRSLMAIAGMWHGSRPFILSAAGRVFQIFRL